MAKPTFQQILESVAMTYKPNIRRKYDLGTPAKHYGVTLVRGGKRWTFPYSMGLGITGGPKKKDVLYSLVMDAQCYESTPDLRDFCREFGYDEHGWDQYDLPLDKKPYANGRYLHAACKRTYQRMNGDFFTKEEYKILQKGFEDY